MSTPSPDPAVSHFGRGGMRRFSFTTATELQLPEPARVLLEQSGAPLQVAPYFTAADPSDALTLGVFAGHQGLPRPSAGQSAWLRLGTDKLAQLCVDASGCVRAVALHPAGEDMFVNSDVAAFNACLTSLDRWLPVIAASSGLQDAAEAFRQLNADLRHTDEDAFAERESWWSRVLDDVRHTLNFPFSAAVEYVDDHGAKQIITEATGPGRAHPEELLRQCLSDADVAPSQVRRVYCELEPCMMPGHYCAVWMQKVFPQAQFTHSFDYGESADSREAGLKDLITHAAQQARRR
ncbi:nucleic acid/nucleotide deaminase domain-containing protein [Streptomyces ochraceiscleroticus]|uniref:Nucleic acid/nucleotide deaminase domain-containing protein n=1 Tax=Streptomyces ochraceiscleroticus TaxID=47761 RepID=A0ABW1MKR7_9ACTN|nr:nucleic acid/nucleotide deaminase domain-containing protein [Streptomyces ochraceiscleroticus]